MANLKARDLEVYKKAFASAVEIHRVSENWPKHELYGGLAEQMRRASRSICANLVEGLAKMGSAEQRRFLNIALGSAEEVQVWSEFAVALGYARQDWGKKMENGYSEIGKMLFGLMQRRDGKGRKA